MEIKGINQLEGEIIRHFSLGTFPVMVLDTSGLIDLVTAMRQYNSVRRNGDRNQRYERPALFLENLAQELPMVITPRTYREIQNHGRTRLNGHTVELTPEVMDFALNTLIKSVEFIDGLKNPVSFDDIRYDTYWAAKYGCDGNHKKIMEGCSDTDREILATAAHISGSNIDDKTALGPVLVTSSDAHVLKGAELLKRGFDGKYSRIMPFSTRH